MTQPAERDRMSSVSSGDSRLVDNADSVAERALLVRIARNDQAALTELYDRAAPRLYAVLLRWVPSPEDADLILQRVFMQVWAERAIRSFSSDRPLLGLIEAARRLALKEKFTRAGRQEDRPGSSWPATPTTKGGPMNGAGLNPRDLLRSIYIDGSTVEELASRHGLSPDALRETLVSAMKELRRGLKT